MKAWCAQQHSEEYADIITNTQTHRHTETHRHKGYACIFGCICWHKTRAPTLYFGWARARAVSRHGLRNLWNLRNLCPVPGILLKPAESMEPAPGGGDPGRKRGGLTDPSGIRPARILRMLFSWSSDSSEYAAPAAAPAALAAAPADLAASPAHLAAASADLAAVSPVSTVSVSAGAAVPADLAAPPADLAAMRRGAAEEVCFLLPRCLPGHQISRAAARLHAVAIINDKLRRSSPSASFKIGITHDPVHRFYTSWGAYKPLGYHRMDVVYGADNTSDTAELERYLIARYYASTQCHNIARGGESAGRATPHFVYVVWRNDYVPKNVIRGTHVRSTGHGRGRWPGDLLDFS